MLRTWACSGAAMPRASRGSYGGGTSPALSVLGEHHDSTCVMVPMLDVAKIQHDQLWPCALQLQCGKVPSLAVPLAEGLARKPSNSCLLLESLSSA